MKEDKELEKAKAWWPEPVNEQINLMLKYYFRCDFTLTNEHILNIFQKENPTPKQEGKAHCQDCNKDYETFGMDLMLSREQWLKIMPEENGLLCAQCTVNRCEKLPDSVNIDAVVKFKSDYSKQEREEEAKIVSEQVKIDAINKWVEGYDHLDLSGFEKNSIRVDFSNGWDTCYNYLLHQLQQSKKKSESSINELVEALELLRRIYLKTNYLEGDLIEPLTKEIAVFLSKHNK